MKINFEKIKLIIWDLDDTFWTGTLSEGTQKLSLENISLLKKLNDNGIINSICSKNDFESTKNYLVNINIWDEFVFSKISWGAKGEIVKATLKDMGLRSCNALFIDDNPSNRQEVLYCCPEIMVAAPEIIEELRQWLLQHATDSDSGRKRLKQYMILEKKSNVKQTMPSNVDFLKDSDIKIWIHSDCEKEVDRIYELLMRSNQLNYTKNRMPIENLKGILADPSYQCAYIEAKDKYGDYGIIGFYAVKNHELVHFTFSCRILGMGIEQYVYNYLTHPILHVVGEVVNELSSNGEIPWIKIEVTQNNTKKLDNNIVSRDKKVLLKGPCDMEQVLVYIGADTFTTELTYINPSTSVSIESYNTTTHMINAIVLSEEEKRSIIEECPFSSNEFFSDKFLDEKFGCVFFSLFSDPNLGLYKRKGSDALVAFGEHCYDLTNQKNWESYISGEIFNANCKFTKGDLKNFSSRYEYVGQIKPKEILKNLIKIRECMPKATVLVLMLGSELEYSNNSQEAYIGRHIYHKELNDLCKEWAGKTNNVKVLEYSKYVTTQDCYYNNINHFTKQVYYYMSKDIAKVIEEIMPTIKVHRKSIFTLIKQSNKIIAFLGKVKNRVVGCLVKIKQKIFNRPNKGMK